MLYIVVALKSEAQAFVDKYKLKKIKLQNFILYYNDDIFLIISGIGITQSRIATQTLINNYDITDNDIYLNVGICGANTSLNIGELLEFSTLMYKNKSYTLHNNSPHTLTCVDEEACESLHSVVDMESYGFYDAVIHSPAIKKYFILKIVSDHFQPHTITKEKTKSLLFNAIHAINIIIKTEAS